MMGVGEVYRSFGHLMRMEYFQPLTMAQSAAQMARESQVGAHTVTRHDGAGRNLSADYPLPFRLCASFLLSSSAAGLG
jgi:hypothetical protein